MPSNEIIYVLSIWDVMLITLSLVVTIWVEELTTKYEYGLQPGVSPGERIL